MEITEKLLGLLAPVVPGSEIVEGAKSTPDLMKLKLITDEKRKAEESLMNSDDPSDSINRIEKFEEVKSKIGGI